MAVYTLFGQAGGGTNPSDSAAYTMGVQFSVSQGGTLTGIWFYSGSWATVLPQTIALYAVAGSSLVASQSASWSGAAGSGWVRAAWTTPPVLTAGAAYKACVLQNTAAAWYSATSNYWSSGAGSAGITSGPLSAPNASGASGGNQDTFNSGATLTYPASAFNSTNYWMDPEVTIPDAQAQQAVTLIWQGHPQSPQSFQAPLAVPLPPPPPAPQQPLNLLLLRLPQSLPGPQLPQPPPPLPAPGQALNLLLQGLPQTPQFSQVPPPPPPPGPLPQSALLVQRGMATPGHFFQAAPVVPPPPAPGVQAEQAVSLLWQGLPQSPPGPLIPAAPPPVPAPGQAVTLLLQGLPQSLPGPLLPGLPPPVPAPQQALTLMLQGLPQAPQSPQLPGAPPPGQQPQHAFTLLARGYAVPAQAVTPPAAALRGCVVLASQLAASVTLASQLAGSVTITSVGC